MVLTQAFLMLSLLALAVDCKDLVHEARESQNVVEQVGSSSWGAMASTVLSEAMTYDKTAEKSETTDYLATVGTEWSSTAESVEVKCMTDAIMAEELGLQSFGSMLGSALDMGTSATMAEPTKSKQQEMTMETSDDLNALEALIAEGLELESSALSSDLEKMAGFREEAPLRQDARLGKAPVVERKGVSLQEAKKSAFVGDQISVSFSAKSPDMDKLEKKTRRNWDLAPNGTVRVIEKDILDISLAGHVEEGCPGNSSDMIRLFGFTNKTMGVYSVKSGRFWTKQPGSGSKKRTRRPTLAYGIKVLNVPEGLDKWDVDISYLSPPPSQLEVFPKGEVAKRDAEGNLYVAFVCDDEIECRDGSIRLARISFTPIKVSKSGKKIEQKMQSPDAALANSASNITANGTNGTNGTAQLFAMPKDPMPKDGSEPRASIPEAADAAQPPLTPLPLQSPQAPVAAAVAPADAPRASQQDYTKLWGVSLAMDPHRN